MKHKSIPPVDVLKQRSPTVKKKKAYKETLSSSNRLALWITTRVGTMGFFMIIFFWTIVWLGWNTLAPNGLRFDPFPAFALWLFVSNMIQIFLMPLIMVGQNLQSKHAEMRAEEDFEINKKAEQEIEAILMHLENQNDLLQSIHSRLDALEKP